MARRRRSSATARAKLRVQEQQAKANAEAAKARAEEARARAAAAAAEAKAKADERREKAREREFQRKQEKSRERQAMIGGIAGVIGGSGGVLIGKYGLAKGLDARFTASITANTEAIAKLAQESRSVLGDVAAGKGNPSVNAAKLNAIAQTAAKHLPASRAPVGIGLGAAAGAIGAYSLYRAATAKDFTSKITYTAVAGLELGLAAGTIAGQVANRNNPTVAIPATDLAAINAAKEAAGVAASAAKAETKKVVSPARQKALAAYQQKFGKPAPSNATIKGMKAAVSSGTALPPNAPPKIPPSKAPSVMPQSSPTVAPPAKPPASLGSLSRVRQIGGKLLGGAARVLTPVGIVAIAATHAPTAQAAEVKRKQAATPRAPTLLGRVGQALEERAARDRATPVTARLDFKVADFLMFGVPGAVVAGVNRLAAPSAGTKHALGVNLRQSFRPAPPTRAQAARYGAYLNAGARARAATARVPRGGPATAGSRSGGTGGMQSYTTADGRTVQGTAGQVQAWRSRKK
jgi:hypothetical protein